MSQARKLNVKKYKKKVRSGNDGVEKMVESGTLRGSDPSKRGTFWSKSAKSLGVVDSAVAAESSCSSSPADGSLSMQLLR